jgi:hypothetical protein
MSFFDCCLRCLAPAPPRSSGEHADWRELLDRRGERLALVCSGCVADEELLVVELEAALEPA